MPPRRRGRWLLILALLALGGYLLFPKADRTPGSPGTVERGTPGPERPASLQGAPPAATLPERGRPSPGATSDQPAEWVSVSGRVLDQRGEPVPGTTVVAQTARVSGETFDGWETEGQETTDAHGAFRFAALPAPASQAVFLRAAESASTSRSARSLVEDPAQEVLLRVHAGFRLRGHVLGPDGRPLEGVRVEATPGTGEQHETSTHDDGAFGLLLEPGTERVGLRVGPFEPTLPERATFAGWTGIVDADQDDLRLTLPAPVFLEGTVAGFDGAPVPAWLAAHRPDENPEEVYVTARSDDAGRFRLGPLRPGPWRVTARPEGEAQKVLRYRLSETLEAQAPSAALRLLCPEGLVLSGRIEGSDLPGFEAAWQGPDDALGPVLRLSAATDETGRFTLAGLSPGRGRLVVRKEADERCAVWEGEPPASDLRLRLLDGLTIRGRLAGGRAYAAQRMLAHLGVLEVAAPLEADGSFVLRGLCPGTWRLEAAQLAGSREPTLSLSARAYGGLPVEAGTADVLVPAR